MEGEGSPLGPAVPQSVELTNEDFPHLSSREWSALERMRDVIGEVAVITLLQSSSPEDQKDAAVHFMQHEIVTSRKQVATPVSSLRAAPLQLDESASSGGENERPKSEFRARVEFLKLRQGRLDLHSYAERARSLLSSIVNEPIDMQTQVVTFMTGLNEGLIRSQLFREFPKTLDEAIDHAMQEEFSIKQAKRQAFASSPPRQASNRCDCAEPMDTSFVSTPGNERPRNDGKCFRCGKPGHIARDCRVSLPGRQTAEGGRSDSHGRTNGRRFEHSQGSRNQSDQ